MIDEADNNRMVTGESLSDRAGQSRVDRCVHGVGGRCIYMTQPQPCIAGGCDVFETPAGYRPKCWPTFNVPRPPRGHDDGIVF